MSRTLLFFSALLLFQYSFSIQPDTISPVTPNASPEAVELLNYLYEISGNHTLSGQHDQPLFGSSYYNRAYEITGHYPAVKGMDFGFSERNTLDGINFRQQIVDDAIEYHREGAIITLMWHAVPPTMDEPVTFREAIQSELTDEEWQELITPGTPINLKWQSQVDVIAFFLKQIQEENIPVLWRPYHEMNGGWFWWGDKKGDDGYRALYRMLFDRLVNYHGISNLLWVFNANEISGDWMSPYSDFYPGHEFVDILATDVYRNNYQGSDYEELLSLGEGRPIALGEVGKAPTPEILAQQPHWVWFMVWVDLFFGANERDDIQMLYDDERILNREDITR